MSLFAKRTEGIRRFAFVLYTLFPAAGVVFDYHVHGFSMSYIGLVVSALIIYTNIYLQKQKIIDEQRNALMLSQINPHFMYNTLSTIAAMCESSPKQAKNLTLEFSHYLRTNLDTLTNTAPIPFVQELKHVACYLKIEKARFREKINVVYSIQCQDFLIPALSVQPIVENAVRHGITKKAEGGTVRISTYCTDTSYVIEVKDDGIGFDTEEKPNDGKTHVGLSNVQARIVSMCHGEMTVKSIVGVGTRVLIEIPMEKKKKRENKKNKKNKKKQKGRKA
jgi:LytS/YehU family sensor histidine kinase